jgi:hypothetical protein
MYSHQNTHTCKFADISMFPFLFQRLYQAFFDKVIVRTAATFMQLALDLRVALVFNYLNVFLIPSTGS